MDSMSSNQVWTLVDRPKGVKPVGCKWVYKCKNGVDREMTTFKARLVGKEYTQRPGVKSEETFSPIAMAKSIWIMLSIAAWYDYELEGFTVVGEEQKVYHLQKFIYGLKQASKAWNIRFDEVIQGYDFVKNNFDPCVYKKVSESSVVFLVLYVDDILLIGNDIRMLGDTKAWLSTQFSMKDLVVNLLCDNNRGYSATRNRDLITDPNLFLDDTIWPHKRWWEEVTFGWTESAQQKYSRFELTTSCHQSRLKRIYRAMLATEDNTKCWQLMLQSGTAVPNTPKRREEEGYSRLTKSDHSSLSDKHQKVSCGYPLGQMSD
ncbi:UNVERIFIED_CONTAM: Retrovirus-related Pol polyprotein from transposon TNT 1-94 [Sesamum calycinum]|uniref:Retrovirus-related Pol polyprotein from transposon TNT 1-94 n=1 Tax=Sesamum calycinum TaxID=2727403 RepID=A0AAW2JDL5_9LAMI